MKSEVRTQKSEVLRNPVTSTCGLRLPIGSESAARTAESAEGTSATDVTTSDFRKLIAKLKNQQQEVHLTIASILGGAVGGIGHHHYNKNYSTNSVQGTIGSDALSGLIAGFIGMTFIALKLKREYTLRQACAIAMGMGLGFHAVFGGIKSIVTAQTQIYQLQREVETEQSESIEKIQALATKGDSYVKQEAIEKLAEIGKRSNQPEKSIAAIQDLARDSSDEEVKQEAIEGLTDIASESESFTVVEEAVEAIAQSTELKSKEEVIRHLKELERLATEAATVEKRQVLIESISEYEGQHDEEIDRLIEEIRTRFNKTGRSPALY